MCIKLQVLFLFGEKEKKNLKSETKNIFNKAIIRKFKKKKNEERLTKGEIDVQNKGIIY